MTLYIITLLFLCNLVVSLNPSPNAQDTAGSSISQPCQGIDSQDPCEPLSHWLTGDNNEDDRICFSDADCPINFHCYSRECIRSPRDSLKKVPALQLASVGPVWTVPQGTTAGVEAAFKSHVPLRNHFSLETTINIRPMQMLSDSCLGLSAVSISATIDLAAGHATFLNRTTQRVTRMKKRARRESTGLHSYEEHISSPTLAAPHKAGTSDETNVMGPKPTLTLAHRIGTPTDTADKANDEGTTPGEPTSAP
ncbi:hypothetical protein BDV33DRAFT_198995 [Aspergillus novoparasiticus]|uniref:Extracellular membrane protein CFEM domain-containing protein n=1 Tax=Aspergillus novoparasiticus TaxID=986946 RepID=A0A5N6F5M5_9EURO|nr:hypothetical protein BDV33DRAFT_198995 [Aspergillus novoparasiticus]